MPSRFVRADSPPFANVLGASREAEAVAEKWGLRLEWTACHYGGRRPWLLCPRCGRRCAKLYLVTSLEPCSAACRLCWRLAYTSQRLEPMERWARQAQALRQRLGGPPDLSLPLPSRPAGMRRKTYARLRRRLRDVERACEGEDLKAWARANRRGGDRHWTLYWEARERFLRTFAPSRQDFRPNL